MGELVNIEDLRKNCRIRMAKDGELTEPIVSYPEIVRLRCKDRRVPR